MIILELPKNQNHTLTNPRRHYGSQVGDKMEYSNKFDTLTTTRKTPKPAYSVVDISQQASKIRFHQANFFRKFRKFSKKFCLLKPYTLKNTFLVKFWSNFARFCQKKALFGSKTMFFSKFRRLRRRNWVFSAAFGGRSMESLHPPGGPPPQISLMKIAVLGEFLSN